MENIKKMAHLNKKILIAIIIILAIQSLAYIYAGNEKPALNVDEYFTYQLSNGVFGVTDPVENGKIYKNSNPFFEQFVVDKENRFDYKEVWENQARDVHPPLYYAIFHTVSSFMPEIFSKWTGIGINIFLALFVTILVYFITKELCNNSAITLIVALTFALAPSSINNIVFIRMYVLLSIWILGITLLHLKYIKKDVIDNKFFVILTCLAVCGTITQYYFLIFLFFICLYFGVFLIVKRRWIYALKYVISLVFAGCISLLIFPTMVNHIFGSGYRGKESFANLASSDFGSRLSVYFEIMKNQIFGGRFSTAILLCTILLIIGMSSKNIRAKLIFDIKKNNSKMIIIFPTVLYFLLVVKISPYLSERYMFCIYPFIWMAFVLLIFRGLNSIKNGKVSYKEYIVILMISTFFISYSYKAGITYMTKEEEQNIEISKESNAETLLCIYDNQQWKLMASYLEFDNYNKLVFIPYEQINILKDRKYQKLDKMQLYISTTLNQEEVIEKVLDRYSKYSTASNLYNPNYGNVYQLQ